MPSPLRCPILTILVSTVAVYVFRSNLIKEFCRHIYFCVFLLPAFAAGTCYI